MEFLIVFFLILAFIGFTAIAKVDTKTQQKEIVKDIKKVCPPHKWFYQEIKDHEGVTHAWKLVCEICGPLRPSDGPARMDY